MIKSNWLIKRINYILGLNFYANPFTNNLI